MRYLLLLFFSCVVLFQNFGQTNSVISGKILDAATGQRLQFASVSISGAISNTLAGGTITDEKGIFILRDIPAGEYAITVSFIGFESKSVNLLVGKLNNTYDVGKIELSPSVSEIEEVQITGREATVSSSLEKKSFNIDENISQSGGSVLKAMQNLPGITVDQDGQVYLRGSNKVTILIDGKQSSLTGNGNQKSLDNIPASNIDRIEIINNPSAKYDAKGMAGIVNIIYKAETKKGFNGEFSIAAGIGEINQRRDNLPGISEKYSQTPKLSPGFSLNYRADKVNIFLQGDGMVRRKINCNEFSTRNYFDAAQPDISSQFLENRSQQLYNIKAGLDWFLNDNNTLTFFTLWEDEYHIDRGDVPYDDALIGQRYRLWEWAEDEDTKFINFSVLYNHKFAQPGHKLDIGYIYTGGGEDELFPFTDSSSVRVSTDQTFLKAYEYVSSVNIDYVKPLKNGRIETGSKLNFRHLPIEFYRTPGINSILDPNIGEYSDYYENVLALYINYVFESKFLEIEGGLRAEQSFIKYKIDPANIYYDKDDKYNYFDLFPNTRLTYKINERNRISAFLNRRIDRPGEFELRPFPKYDDPEILKTGNPFLRPQYTLSYELSYKNIWKSGSSYFSAFHRDISDIFSRVYTADTSSSYTIVNTIPANLGKGTNTGFEIFAEQKVTEWLKLNGSFNWYHNTINAFSGTHIYPYPQTFDFPKTDGNTWNSKINAILELSKGYNFQFSAIYYAPDIIPQGVIRSRYSIDFGISKKLKKDRMEIYLNANDILNTFAIETNLKSETFLLHKINYVETQVVMAGMKYKF